MFFKAQNAPKLRWGSLQRSPDPKLAGEGDTSPRSPAPRRFRRLYLAAFGPSLLTPPQFSSANSNTGPRGPWLWPKI